MERLQKLLKEGYEKVESKYSNNDGLTYQEFIKVIKMRNIELELADEDGYYTESFQGRWIIDPEEELRVDQFFEEDIMRIPDQGDCCAVAQKDTGALVFYAFHKNGLRDPYMDEFDPIEGVGLDASDELIISTIKEMLE